MAVSSNNVPDYADAKIHEVYIRIAMKEPMKSR
jgi:hypothetical protein